MQTRTSLFRNSLLFSLATLVLPGCPTGNPPANQCGPGTASGSTTVSYANDVVPLLALVGCSTSACHGGSFPSSNYDLRTYESAFVAGDEAGGLGLCEIAPGDISNSYLIEKIRSANPRSGLQMPLEREPLSEAQIVLIETWIREGAQNN